MAEQVNIEFNFDTSKSNKSVQQLQKEIRVLNKELANTKVGSNEFEKFNNQLVKSRVELQQARKDFKGLEFDLIVNTQDADNSIQGMQANIKSMTLELERVEIGSDEFVKLSQKIAEANLELRGVKGELRGLDFNAVIGEVGKLTAGITSAFTAITAVVGSGNQEFEEFAKVVVQGMAVANGFKGALEGVSSAGELLNNTLEKNPMYKIVAIAGLLITALIALYNWTQNQEEAQKKLNEKQVEWNNALRESSKEVDQLALNIAEANKDLVLQLELFNKITEADYVSEVNKLGEEFKLTAAEVNKSNGYLEAYYEINNNILDLKQEQNKLLSDENNLTADQRVRLVEVGYELQKHEKFRQDAVKSIQFGINKTREENKVSIQVAEQIGNAFVKKNRLIVSDTEKRTKELIEINKTLVESVTDSIKELEDYELDYYNSFLRRETELAIFKTENNLNDLMNNRATVNEIAEIRTKLSDLKIKQAQNEKAEVLKAAKEEQEKIVDNLKNNIKLLEEEKTTVVDKGEVEKQILEANNFLKAESIKLEELNRREVKLSADELNALRDQSKGENLEFLKALNKQQSELLNQSQKDQIEAIKAKYEFDLEYGTSDEAIKAIQQRLYLEKDLTLEERRDMLEEVRILEEGQLYNRIQLESEILKREDTLRLMQLKDKLSQDLVEYEGYFSEIGKLGQLPYDQIKDTFDVTLDGIISTESGINDLLDNLREISEVEIAGEIEKLSGLSRDLTDEEVLRLNILKSQQTVARTLQTELLEYRKDLVERTRLEVQLENLRNKSTEENISLQLKRLQLIDAQANALMRLSDIEVERWTGNLEKQNQAQKKQLDLRRVLELTELESLHQQKLIGDDEYLQAQEDIEEVYRRRRVEADIEAYTQVFEIGKELGDAYFQITANQQQVLFDDKMSKLNDEYNSEVEQLSAAKDSNLITQEAYDEQIDRLNEQKEQKTKKLEYDKAKREKQAAISQAGIETALNVIKSYPKGPAAIALAGATGLAQIAIIQSSPLPQLEKGGLLRGKRHGQGGIPIEAEDGEIVLNRNVSKNPAFLQVASMMNEMTGGKRLSNNAFNSSESNMENETLDIKGMVKEIVDGVASIPVKNVATDTDEVARKVKNLEDKSKL